MTADTSCLIDNGADGAYDILANGVADLVLEYGSDENSSDTSAEGGKLGRFLPAF